MPRGKETYDVHVEETITVWLIQGGTTKYHLVFIPKLRKKKLYWDLRPRLGAIFHALAEQKDCKILEGHLMADHVHMLVEVPPKYAVSSVISFLKGKSVIAIAREFGGKERNYTGEHFSSERVCAVDRGL